jgi:Putative peptidoglycan binding domain
MAEVRIDYEIPAMKKIKLLILIGSALIALGSSAWAGPHTGGGGLAGGGRSGGSHFGGSSGAPRVAPAFPSGGARFSSRSTGALTRESQQFYYYNGARTSGPMQHAFARQLPNRSVTANAGSRTTIARQPTITRQQNRDGSLVRQNTRVGNSQMTAATVRRAIANHNVSARHDGNWHRDWDKHRFHHHDGLVFVFLDGFWWGLSPAYFPGDYYPSYAYDNYPYDSSDYPYDYSYPYNYDDEGINPAADEYGNNATVSAVQSALAKLGYYHGAVDGVLGDATEAALAQYQEDRDLSVTGTVTAATLQSLGLTRTAS